jgi:hypothetical protein
VTGFSHLSCELRCSMKCGDFIEEGLPHRSTSETSRYLCYHTKCQVPLYKSDWAYETTGQFDAVVKLEPF